MQEELPWWHLRSEAVHSRNLARSGTILLRAYRSSEDLAGVLSCFALGAEKLLKLTLGLGAVAEGGAWPSVRTMKKLGHDLVSLDSAARGLLHERISCAEDPSYVQRLVEKVESNRLTRTLVEIMADYGVGGRFHDLDALAESKRERNSPVEQWTQIEQLVLLHSHSGLWGLEGDPGLTKVKEEVEVALLDWWFMYSRGWMQGVFGDDARSHSHSIDVDALQLGMGQDR